MGATDKDGGRIPHAPESEATILGLMMLDPDAAITAIEALEADDFFREPHRAIYRAMVRLFRRGEALAWQGVADELLAIGALDEAGGTAYLGRLHDNASLAVDVAGDVARVADTSRRRQLLGALRKSIQDVSSDADNAEVFDRVEQRVFGIAVRGIRGAPTRIDSAAVLEAAAEIERRSTAGDGITGIPTGLADLDEMTGGLQRQDLVVLAARPSMGKTALALQVALHEARRPGGGTVLLNSMEMSRTQVIDRLLAIESGVNLSQIVRGRCSDADCTRLALAGNRLAGIRMLVDESPALTPLEIRARARKVYTQCPDLSLVVVDYLQLMDAARRHESRQQEVTEISRGLKAAAKDIDVPVLALSQLSRAPEARADHRPQLSDLRESGAIEQDADVVMFLYRPEYYVSSTKAKEEGIDGKAEITIGKQRNGPTGTINLYFRKESTRFENATRWGNT